MRGLPLAVGALLTASLLAASARAEAPATDTSTAIAARAGEENPMRYPPSSVRVPLILGGLGFTAAVYGASAGLAAAWPDAPGVQSLYLPVAGPWMALAENRCPTGEADCGAILYVRGALEALSGLAQLSGLVIALEGIVTTTEAASGGRRASTVRVVPTVSPSVAGLAVHGTF